MPEKKVQLSVTDAQARALIRAASVFGRELAGIWKQTKDEADKAKYEELDAARHLLEKATDEAGPKDA